MLLIFIYVVRSSGNKRMSYFLFDFAILLLMRPSIISCLHCRDVPGNMSILIGGFQLNEFKEIMQSNMDIYSSNV